MTTVHWHTPPEAATRGGSQREEVVVLEEATKRYPGGVTALNGVDLVIRAGEMAAIVGPSGSGKSTLLHLMGTLDRPTSGVVRVLGHEVVALADRQVSALRARGIGFVFQRFHLDRGQSALDNVADGALYSGVSVRERRARAAEALARVGLEHRMDHLPQALSGGERQRVAIARAVIGEPRLLLADEPTGNLDSASGAAVMDLLRELNSDGTTVVVITHDHDIAETLPRVVSLKDGEVTS